MSKDTRLQRTVRRAIERRLAEEQKKKKPNYGRWWKVVLFFLGVPGIYIGTLNLLPKIAVSPLSSLNPSDPFATPFEISNVGYLNLYDVKFLCSYKDVESANGSKILTPGADEETTGGFTTDSLAAERLDRGRKATITCPFLFRFPAPISTADIRIVISFRPEWSVWKKHHVRRFTLAKDAAGQSRWFEQPLRKE
jgi:hypothetical protein